MSCYINALIVFLRREEFIADVNFKSFFFFRSLVCIFTLHHVISHATLKPYGYDITQYTRALPEELRETVKKALVAERNAVQSSALQLQEENDCQKDEEEEALSCPPSKYRTQTGECNNVRHPRWGTKGTPFLRLLPPDYADGKKIFMFCYSMH